MRPKRPLGEILLELEPLVEEAIDQHDLQWGDWLALQFVWLMTHRPNAREEYTAGGHPEFYYGPERKKDD